MDSPKEPDGRSAIAVGYAWAARVTSVSMEMALPPAAGAWADHRFGTSPWLLIVGAVLGFTAGMSHLLRIAREASPPSVRRSHPADKKHPPNGTED